MMLKAAIMLAMEVGIPGCSGDIVLGQCRASSETRDFIGHDENSNRAHIENEPCANVVSFRCPICERNFERENCLENHVKLAHEQPSEGERSDDLDSDSDIELLEKDKNGDFQ